MRHKTLVSCQLHLTHSIPRCSAVDALCSDPQAREEKYGHTSCWNTSAVTIMTKLFKGKKDFNLDVSQWNTSRIIRMRGVFSGASSLKKKVSHLHLMYRLFSFLKKSFKNLGCFLLSGLSLNRMSLNSLAQPLASETSLLRLLFPYPSVPFNESELNFYYMTLYTIPAYLFALFTPRHQQISI